MRRAVVVAVVVLSALGLGGCGGAARGAEPTRTAVARPGVAGDPLDGVERGVDAVERDLDADSAVAR